MTDMIVGQGEVYFNFFSISRRIGYKEISILYSITMTENETEAATATSGNFDSNIRYTGRVKWFNNKSGYGFSTVLSAGGDRDGEDIFCHHSGVKVGQEQYKYLVQGEYVEFNLRGSDNVAHPYQADSLTGVGGGKLMCETRNEQRRDREQREERDPRGERDQYGEREQRGEGEQRGERSSGRRYPRHNQGERIRLRGSGPRGGETWTLTKDAPNVKYRPRPRRQDNA